MKKIILTTAFALISFTSIAQADQLEEIQKAGVLKVGTTGDYKPFSYLNNGEFSGYDIDVAKHFAKELGVKVEFVKTTWKDLLSGLSSDKYDIAMGGITRRMQRQLSAEQSQGYMTFGKCFLVAKGKSKDFDTIEEVNKASVKVGVNIGGTNEMFADENLSKATFTRFENNLDVPKAVASGKVDVMVTETPEALYYQVIDKRLEASRCEDPFTKGEFGYLIPKGEQEFLNVVNYMMDEMKLKGLDEVFMEQNSFK